MLFTGNNTPLKLINWCFLQVKDGDRVRIDAENRKMDVLDVDESEWQKRRDQWQPLPLKATQGTLYKYIKSVTSASTGCVTDA